MSSASINSVRSAAGATAMIPTVLISAVLIATWVASPAVVHADGDLGEVEVSLTDQDVSRMLADSLVVSLAPVSAADLDAIDRSRAVATDPSIADDESALWTTLAPLKSEAEVPAMRPTLPRSSRPHGITLAAGAVRGGADHSDPFPHSRVTMPLLVGGLVGDLADSGDAAAGSNFRPLAGAAVGVRPSYLRPRLPGER